MKAISCFLLLSLMLFQASRIHGQEKMVDYTIECPKYLERGDTLRFVVLLDIEDAYHINAPGYFDHSGGFPTDLEFTTPLPKGLINLGKAKMMDAEGNAFGSQVRGKGIRLVQLFTYAGEPAQKELLLKGTLYYQVCDMQSCHAPVSIPFESMVQIIVKK